MHTYVRARVVEKRYVASIVITPKIKVGRGKAENSMRGKSIYLSYSSNKNAEYREKKRNLTHASISLSIYTNANVTIRFSVNDKTYRGRAYNL